MSLPKLLRRLRVMAASGDERGTADTLALLAAHSGWARDVDEFIDSQLSDDEADFVQGVIDSPPPSQSSAAFGTGSAGGGTAVATVVVAAPTDLPGTPGGIIWGQSNPTTAGAATSSLSAGNASLASSYQNIPILFQTGLVTVNTAITWRYYDGCAIHASNGIANPPSTFGPVSDHFSVPQSEQDVGPEVKIVRDLVAGNSTTQRIAKITLDGSSLAQHWLGTHAPGQGYAAWPTTGTPLYDQFSSFLASSGISPRWFYAGQGETDAGNATDAGNWALNFGVIVALVQTFNFCPVIVGQLNTNINPTGHANASTVIAQQTLFAQTTPWTTLLNYDDLTLQGDGVHYTADSTVTIGARVAAAVIAARNTTTLTATLTQPTEPVTTSQQITYTLQVNNTGSTAALNAAARITLPSGSVFVSASGTGWTCTQASGVVTCTNTSIAAGAANPVSITINAPGSVGTGTITATGTLVANNVKELTSYSMANTITSAAVSRDATSLIYVPASSTEWTNFITANSLTGFTASNVIALWLMQDASGSPADVMGSFPLTVSGTVITYQSPVPGWSRKGINCTANNVNMKNTSASLPAMNTADATLVIFATVTAPASAKGLGALGVTTVAQAQADNVPKVIAADGANVANGANNYTGAVRPFIIKHKATATSEARVYTDQEKLSPTFSASVTGKGVQIMGSPSAGPPNMTVVYAYLLNVAPTDAQIKSLAQAHGFTIPWT